MRKNPFLLAFVVCCCVWAAPRLRAAEEPAPTPAAPKTLGIDGARFTLNGRPTFLLGISYYSGLGASDEILRRDLDDLTARGFNWIRVWATWESFGKDVSAVDAHGKAREAHLARLKALVAECDRRGVVVDVTLARGAGPGHLADLAAHRDAVETIVTALKERRNWYLDLANERDVRDARFVSIDELRTLREDVRRLDAARLVTASTGGHDLTEADVRDALLVARLDFLAPHRPRTPESPGQTAEQTRKTLALMKRLNRVAPVHYQEPFRRGYTKWDPAAEDFLADLRGAAEGGAAGWCFHNGSQRGGEGGGKPRRSFDLSEKRLFEQLDEEERKAAEEARRVVDTVRQPAVK
jgi:hypothetical protein